MVSNVCIVLDDSGLTSCKLQGQVIHCLVILGIDLRSAKTGVEKFNVMI